MSYDDGMIQHKPNPDEMKKKYKYPNKKESKLFEGHF